MWLIKIRWFLLLPEKNKFFCESSSSSKRTRTVELILFVVRQNKNFFAMFISAPLENFSAHSHNSDSLCTDAKINILSFLPEFPWLPTSREDPKSVKALYGRFHDDSNKSIYRILNRHIVDPNSITDLLYDVETITIHGIVRNRIDA
jgi:hypothetical protein